MTKKLDPWEYLLSLNHEVDSREWKAILTQESKPQDPHDLAHSNELSINLTSEKLYLNWLD